MGAKLTRTIDIVVLEGPEVGEDVIKANCLVSYNKFMRVEQFYFQRKGDWRNFVKKLEKNKNSCSQYKPKEEPEEVLDMYKKMWLKCSKVSIVFTVNKVKEEKKRVLNETYEVKGINGRYLTNTFKLKYYNKFKNKFPVV